jgi:post-segregation antitoxin (ccd killing protein)
MAEQPEKQQFNVYLPAELIRRAKHAAIDHTMSLSRLVELALGEHLDRLERKAPSRRERETVQ